MCTEKMNDFYLAIVKHTLHLIISLENLQLNEWRLMRGIVSFSCHCFNFNWSLHLMCGAKYLLCAPSVFISWRVICISNTYISHCLTTSPSCNHQMEKDKILNWILFACSRYKRKLVSTPSALKIDNNL